jgi:hypothetical protein
MRPILRRVPPIGIRRRWRARTKTMLVALLVGAAGLPAAAEQGTPDDRQACTQDVFRLCGEFIPDASRITACLHQRVRDLSPACRLVFTGSGSSSARR